MRTRLDMLSLCKGEQKLKSQALSLLNTSGRIQKTKTGYAPRYGDVETSQDLDSTEASS